MILPNHGFSLFQDSSLNRTPTKNRYILCYEIPNEISQDFLDRAWTLLSVVKIADLEDQTVTHGILYKFAMLNSIERSHLGKNIISPNW